jgi:hypothetical protein
MVYVPHVKIKRTAMALSLYDACAGGWASINAPLLAEIATALPLL